MGTAAVIKGIDVMEDLQEQAKSGIYFFLDEAEDLDEMAEKLAEGGGGNIEKNLEKKLDKLKRDYSRRGMGFAVFIDDVPFIEPDISMSPELKALVFASRTSGLVSTGTEAAYVANAEAKTAGYTLVLFDIAFNFQKYEFDENPEHIFMVLLLTVLVITLTIIIYNIILSRFVFRHITSALAALVSGVNTIRDGDLACRIRYTAKDEFLPVCEAFNEMAGRLLAGVQAKQRDEASRQELMAGISHDLRTPLTSIKAYAESLAGNVADSPAKREKYINTIKMKADDMEKLIQQLFLFSKLETSEFPMDIETIDVNKELAIIVDALKEEFDRSGIVITPHTGGEELLVRLDRLQFRNAVYNILDNSRKYKNADRGTVVIASRTTEGKVFVTISDDGPGVPGEALGKLFDVFYRSDPARSASVQGSGLGLAITAKIMRQLGGNIRAENNADKGLSIIITLPLYGNQHEEKNTDN